MESRLARRLAAALTFSCLACAMTACGVESSPLPGSPESAMVLTDAASGALFNLSVTDGALVLAKSPNAPEPQANAGLRDSVTGSTFQVGVADGALTLQPGGSAQADRIALADSVTSKTYDLAVADGALTLVPANGGSQ